MEHESFKCMALKHGGQGYAAIKRSKASHMWGGNSLRTHWTLTKVRSRTRVCVMRFHEWRREVGRGGRGCTYVENKPRSISKKLVTEISLKGQKL